MNTLLRHTLLLALVAGSVGCGESPQPGSAAQPPASGADAAAPAVQHSAAPAQNAMEVRQPEGSPLPPPATPGAPTTSAAARPTASMPEAAVAAPAASATKAAAAKGTLLKTSELKEKPFIDAKTLTSLPAQTAVTILERSGGWLHVQAAAQSGWLRMLNVKVTEGAQKLTSGTDLTQAATLATGRAGTGNVVSTSGLRGLSEEELRSAKPDYAQFDKLNGFAVDKSSAADYAKSHGLASRSLHYLPAPAK